MVRKIVLNIFNNSLCGSSAFKNIFLSSFSGQQIVNDFTHKIVIKEDGTQSLIIVPAVPKDSGEWTVVAQNRAGRTSVVVNLSVEGRTWITKCYIYRNLTSVSLLTSALFWDLQPEKAYPDLNLLKN